MERDFSQQQGYSKEMLPILNKPLIQYGVEEALEAGISNIAIRNQEEAKRAIEGSLLI